MHLYGKVLDNYVARDLPSQTLAAIDVHVSNCLFCAHTLASPRLALIVCRGGAAPRNPIAVVVAQRARRVLGQRVAVALPVGSPHEGRHDVEIPFRDLACFAPEVGEPEVDVELQ